MDFDKVVKRSNEHVVLIKPTDEDGLFVLRRTKGAKLECLVSRCINMNIARTDAGGFEAKDPAVVEKYVQQDEDGMLSFSKSHPFLMDTHAGGIAILGQQVQELSAFKPE